jgi:hypothetical protein
VWLLSIVKISLTTSPDYLIWLILVPEKAEIVGASSRSLYCGLSDQNLHILASFLDQPPLVIAVVYLNLVDNRRSARYYKMLNTTHDQDIGVSFLSYSSPHYIMTPEALARSANYAAGVVTVVAVLVMLYKKCSLAGRKGIPLPPGPPARWFWNNALPTVK